ncbi:GTPase Era [Ferrimonas lipolytica]|uniref:GTPase Era n=1 Tax=Ferrimonas lipolytica TaxID=2724191 RepID=A0A6H1UFU6_9GAMM|nr:GTPase Era [Ferrimonas lipolytica]QIZ77499.1 GTPase Era [Ferrimonas lipolytica]
MTDTTFCGFVAIVGRPNVGKSTLLNSILGQKISITSRKPQTTRHRIMGIHTEGSYQTIFVDTPGLHVDEKKAINRLMNRAAASSIGDVEMVVMVVEGTKWSPDDQMVLNKVKRGAGQRKTVLVVNKVDQVKNKEELFPHLEWLQQQFAFDAIIPMSAGKGDKPDQIVKMAQQLLPEGVHYFPEEYVTDRSQRFMAAEILREKLIRFLGDELPYSLNVEIEQFGVDEKGTFHINALILVERTGQKRMVIGNNGEKIKVIGREARIDMEELFDTKVYLETWVKVKSGWADDERALRSLGYGDD